MGTFFGILFAIFVVFACSIIFGIWGFAVSGFLMMTLALDIATERDINPMR